MNRFPRSKRVPLSFLLVSILAAFSACSDETSAPGRVDSPVVYGVDDRQDVYAHPSAMWRERARRSAVALFGKSSLVRAFDGTWSTPAPTLGDGLGLCDGERFADQPAGAFCSGTLVGEDLVLTAGHCIETQNDCENMRFAFDYLYESEGVLATIEDGDVYTCEAIVARRLDEPPRLDYALIRLDRPVVGDREPAAVDRSYAVQTSDSVTVIGFPSGIPAKIDDGGEVTLTRSGTLDYFVATSDTFAGSSGSGTYADDGTLVGILVRGNRDYVADGPCDVVNVLAEGETLSEDHTYAAAAIDDLCGTPAGAETSLCAVEPGVDGGVGGGAGGGSGGGAGGGSGGGTGGGTGGTSGGSGDAGGSSGGGGCSTVAGGADRSSLTPFALLGLLALFTSRHRRAARAR